MSINLRSPATTTFSLTRHFECHSPSPPKMCIPKIYFYPVLYPFSCVTPSTNRNRGKGLIPINQNSPQQDSSHSLFLSSLQQRARNNNNNSSSTESSHHDLVAFFFFLKKKYPLKTCLQTDNPTRLEILGWN